MSRDLLLTFNAGSSTVKIGVFELQREAAQRIAKAVIDFRAAPPTFRFIEGPHAETIPLTSVMGEELHEIVSETFAWLAQHYPMHRLRAVGHRVVHGGDEFDKAAAIDADAIARIEALSPLAPLHQPHNLRLIRAVARVNPGLAQTASFDTAFHRTNDDLVRRFALPRAIHDSGVKRYGFHGLSYKSIAATLKQSEPEISRQRVLAAHLGSGASLCAMHDGVSRDSSMGFSTLDGIPMATRCGALDAGVVLHLLGHERRSFTDVEDMLYHKSGLLGVSGISADARALLESQAPEARQALDLFALRTAGEIARLANTLGGLDALVFTAGIGENAPSIRANIAARLNWLGAALDENANAANARCISKPEAKVKLYVIPTDEEQVIADEALTKLKL